MEPIISVRGLGKSYRIQTGERKPYRTLRDDIADFGKGLLKGQWGNPRSEEFWALRDIDFDIYPGEVVGIIGRNGAGKSTLLKILSRVVQPTTGEAILKGRVASLLEVGTGFHPELTGRENIFISGAVLGMKQVEIKQKFDKIVDFSEIEKFLDMPVKHYSSGMYVRLAFAVAAHLDPEILFIDEILAVGDIEFQKKCLGKINNIATEEGKTVLFVSHNTTAIKNLCRRTVWLSQGNLIEDNSTDIVMSKYFKEDSSRVLKRNWGNPGKSFVDKNVQLQKICLLINNIDSDQEIKISDQLTLEIQYWNFLEDALLNFSLLLYTSDNTCVFNTLSYPQQMKTGLIKGTCEFPKNLLNNLSYKIRLLIVKDAAHIILDVEDIITFDAYEGRREIDWHGKWNGVIRPNLNWKIEFIEKLIK
jgi:lipopolysaccharide transport system ATP-binding protein